MLAAVAVRRAICVGRRLRRCRPDCIVLRGRRASSLARRRGRVRLLCGSAPLEPETTFARRCKCALERRQLFFVPREVVRGERRRGCVQGAARVEELVDGLWLIALCNELANACVSAGARPTHARAAAGTARKSRQRARRSGPWVRPRGKMARRAVVAPPLRRVRHTCCNMYGGGYSMPMNYDAYGGGYSMPMNYNMHPGQVGPPQYQGQVHANPQGGTMNGSA